ncbi:MAG: di-trans,poly-cis-decaprenylcistransferase [Rhodobacteraceae bacterium]|nr:MAG: di-trans,poly-cis-decaprenylcistransferase [Paracoccaceae bacterium]
MPDGSRTRPTPRHVAIVMDGNGRWAANRGLARLEGHRRGADAVRRVVEACPDFGVETLTLFAFSTENWSRPPSEISGLMTLFRRYLRRDAAELVEKGVRVRFIGDRAPLAPDIRALMESVEAQTVGGERLTVVIAINYGGRADIARAARRLAAEVASGRRAADDIDEAAFGAALFTADVADPDLVIRTSGEQRISNFLLWQAAYAEFVFAPEFWPDFDRDAFARALSAYGARERRFGALAE